MASELEPKKIPWYKIFERQRGLYPSSSSALQKSGQLFLTCCHWWKPTYESELFFFTAIPTESFKFRKLVFPLGLTAATCTFLSLVEPFLLLPAMPVAFYAATALIRYIPNRKLADKSTIFVDTIVAKTNVPEVIKIEDLHDSRSSDQVKGLKIAGNNDEERASIFRTFNQLAALRNALQEIGYVNTIIDSRIDTLTSYGQTRVYGETDFEGFYTDVLSFNPSLLAQESTSPQDAKKQRFFAYKVVVRPTGVEPRFSISYRGNRLRKADNKFSVEKIPVNKETGDEPGASGPGKTALPTFGSPRGFILGEGCSGLPPHPGVKRIRTRTNGSHRTP